MSPRSTPPLRGGSFPLPWEWDSIKTSVFTRPPNRDSSTSAGTTWTSAEPRGPFAAASLCSNEVGFFQTRL